jgi:hypothetical protein
VYGLPLESTTNEASRQQLAVLRPSKLTLSFVRPTVPLFKELEGLVGETTDVLEIRYIPAGSGRLALPSVLICDPLQAFKKVVIYLYLPRTRIEVPGPFGASAYIPGKDQPAVSEFLASLISALEVESQEVQERYEVWRVEGWQIPGAAQMATKERLWPEVLVEAEVTEVSGLAIGDEAASAVAESAAAVIPAGPSGWSKAGSKATTSGKQPVTKERDHWDRETNLRLLGGLVNLRLESKKH